MRNLAMHDDCSDSDKLYVDEVIESELLYAGIAVIRHDTRTKNEVPWSVSGEIRARECTFTRGWSYWIVSCCVPLKLATEMYAVKGRKDVRVAGHCGAPPPEEWAEPSEDHIRYICEQENKKGNLSPSMTRLIMDSRYIKIYHIDTQEGLNFFAKCIRTNKVEM